jgi:hypothetical protein
MPDNDGAIGIANPRSEYIELPDPNLAPALMEPDPESPFQIPLGGIDGLESVKAAGLLKRGGQSPVSESGGSLRIRMPGYGSTADLALAAMQYLPTPLLVLSNLKTVVLANDAMGRLMGINEVDAEDIDDAMSDCGKSPTDKLKGKSLSQIGIDMLQDGRPVWVAWESFLDGVAEELGTHLDDNPVPSARNQSEAGEGDATPTAERSEPTNLEFRAETKHSMVHDAVVEVVIATGVVSTKSFAPQSQQPLPIRHIFAKMIITIWEMEDERFYSLTFTNTASSASSLPSSRGQSRQVIKAAASQSGSRGSGTNSSPSSISSSGGGSTKGSSSASSAITSPSGINMSTSPFPPMGPPSKSALSSAPSYLQKAIMMKDALLDNTNTPILAMWKDESLTVPNKGK